ncbi:mucin-19-like isoform X2 [Rhinatrema bivittatum]|uniref:mucin-19-like isoform X2 n=1 Tax=Rhinatrema bivittatum TaxID=194408 RepID=UPI0011268EA1|nr:mucin-19-like isoform X2 [Rhinatrema bivittatum]
MAARRRRCSGSLAPPPPRGSHVAALLLPSAAQWWERSGSGMERGLRPVLFGLCCLLGAGVMRASEDLRTLAAVSLPVGRASTTAPSKPDTSTLAADTRNSVLRVQSSPMYPTEPSDSAKDQPALTGPTRTEGPVSLADGHGQLTSTMEAAANISGAHTVPWREPSTEDHEIETPGPAAPGGTAASPATPLDTKGRTGTRGSTQTEVTAFGTSGTPAPKGESSTATAPSPAAKDGPTESKALTEQEERPIQDPGDSETEVSGSSRSSGISSEPLMVAVISVFVIVLGILALVGFLRYKQRHKQTEFHRLQDLPMDDIMEESPLALYSY